MKAEDKAIILQKILEKFPGTIPEIDIDWEIVEIAFKAGIEEGIKRVTNAAHNAFDTMAEDIRKAGYEEAMAQLANMTEECKQMGRKEVVEWINTLQRGGHCPHCNTYISADKSRLQAKLKDWGMK